jgi:hypothetical protein
MIFFYPFFHKIQWFPTSFCKTFSPFFSKNINICMRHYWVNRYLLWSTIFKVTLQCYIFYVGITDFKMSN